MTTTRLTRFRFALIPLAAVALALCGFATPARAGLIIQALDATVAPGGTGSFDVVLKDDGGTFQISGFTVEVAVTAGSGVTFTAADTLTDSTKEPYLFGTYQSSPLPFATDPANPGVAASFPNNDFVAGDVSMTSPGFVTLNSGDILGLAHVSFSVDSGVPVGDTIAVTIVTGGNTSLADDSGAPVAFSPSDGTIKVAATPEPSSLVLGGIGLLGLAIYARARSYVRGRPHLSSASPLWQADARAHCSLVKV